MNFYEVILSYIGLKINLRQEACSYSLSRTKMTYVKQLVVVLIMWIICKV